MRIAFLGLGRMGVRMAAHLPAAGHQLVVWNRTPGRAGDLVAAGATEACSITEAVRGVDAVVLMLFGPDSVAEVLPEVLTAGSGCLVLNATTVGPADARAYAAACREQGLRYVDAPVAGSTAAAADGTLGVFAGGSDDDYAQAVPLLHLWGDPDKVRRVGEVGSASALKLCVNQGLGVMAAGVGEALRLGRDLGLDRDLLLDVLGAGGYGWYLGQKRPMVESGDYGVTAFSIDLMAKDLDLALRAADSDLPVTAACLTQARRAVDAGHSGEDYAAMTGHAADEGEAGSY